ncbi:MAG: flagellar hook-associated protein FlgK [Oscillospiraceae bacterium]|nr:flagellar hook-associated protein FlgK [Oscillospiraceae bacterium]MBR6695506.1 flagellar hook-associated protein FlgK [Oscillospiraceae bacterium]
MSSLRPSFMGIESMKQTMYAAQKSLDITGNNIANVNTLGYSRQRADQVSISVSASSLYFNTSRALAGQGAATSGITQIRDKLLDKRYRDLNSGTALANIANENLRDIENVLDVFDTTGFYGIYNKFKDILSQFGTDNTDRKELANVTLEYGKQMCQAIKNYDEQIDKIHDQVRLDAETSTDKVNSIFKQIHELNDQIKDAYVTSGDIIVDSTQFTGYKVNSEYGPNELKDQLNALVDELSTFGNVNLTENSDGTFDVEFANHLCVQGDRNYATLEIAYYKDNKDVTADTLKDVDEGGIDPKDCAMKFFFNDGSEMRPTESGIASGAMRGYLDMYNGGGVYASELGNEFDGMSNGVPYYREMINALANTMAEAFNDACVAGDMFSSTDGGEITAANIKVADDWKNDALLITKNADGEVAEGEELSNEYLNKIRAVIDKGLDFSRTTAANATVDQSDMTIDKYVSYWENKLGQDISYTTSVYDTYNSMAFSLSNQRDSIMGVNMDEEGANMMQFQKWYNASARMMTALDEALDKIINGMGLVGR